MEPNNLSVQTTQIASLENELSNQPQIPHAVPKPPPKQQGWNWKWFAFVLILLVVIAIAAFGLIKFRHKKPADPAKTTIKVQDVDLNQIDNPAATLDASASDRVVINGLLQTNKAILLTPTAEPTATKLGTLYLDETTKQLRYYNGTSYATISTESGAGTKTLSETEILNLIAGFGPPTILPQDLATTASPQFAGLTIPGLTPNGVVVANTNGALQSVTTATAGQCLISTSSTPIFSSCGGASVANINGVSGSITIQGTANRVIVANNSPVAGTITLSTPQDIHTGASPQFAGLNLANGSFSLNLTSNPLTQGRNITFGNEDGVVCTSGSNACTNYAPMSGSSAYIQFAPASAQVDSSSDPLVSTIYVSKTGTAGDIVRIQGTGDNGTEDAFRLQASGDMYFKSLTQSNNAFKLLGSDGRAAFTLSTKPPSALLPCTVDFEGGACPINSASAFSVFDDYVGGTPTTFVDAMVNHTTSGTWGGQITNGSFDATKRHGIFLPYNLPYFTDDDPTKGTATYTISFYAFRSDSGGFNINSGFYRDTNSGLDGPVAPGSEVNDRGYKTGWTYLCNAKAVKKNKWTKFSCTFDMTDTQQYANRDADGVFFYLVNNTNKADGQVITIDDLQIVQGTSTSSYTNFMTITAPLQVNPADYTSAFSVKDGGGGDILNVDSYEKQVVINIVRGTEGPGGTNDHTPGLDVTNDNGSVARFASSDSTNSDPTVIIQTVASQTQDLLSLQNSSGNEMTAFDEDGRLIFHESPASVQVATFRFSGSNDLTANQSYYLPDSTGEICLSSGNCSGAGATLQTAYNTSTGGTTPEILLGSTRTTLDIQDAATTIGANLLSVWASGVDISIGDPLFAVGSTGQTILQNSADSATAFQVKDMGGDDVLTVDTVSGTVILGTDSSLAGQLQFYDGVSTYGMTLQTDTLTVGDSVISLPNTAGVNDEICLVTLGNCAGTGSSITGSGSTGTIAIFTGTDTIGNSSLTESGGNLSASGSLTLQGGSLTAGAAAQLGSLVIHDGNGQTATIRTADQTASRVITIPATGADDTLCLYNAGNCFGAGSGATLQAAYNASTGGTTPEVKLDSTRTALDIQDADTTIGGNLLNIRESNGAGLGDILFGVGNTGVITAQNSVDSATALMVKDNAGTNIVKVDTVNGTTSLRSKFTDPNVTEQLADQDCATANWTRPAGWSTWGSGICLHSYLGGTGALTTSQFTPTPGVTYTVTYTVSFIGYYGGTITASLGGVSGPAISSTGTYSTNITAADGSALAFTPTNEFNGFLYGPSIKIAVSSSRASALNVEDVDGNVALEVRTSSYSKNTALGYGSLSVNVTGSYNTTLGYQSLAANTGGSYNSALGYQALQSNTTGSSNIALGYQALQSNNTGSSNIALGYQALQSNITGASNTAIGYISLHANTSGVYNTAVGTATLASNVSGSYNTAIGYNALYSNNSGGNNTAIGNSALNANTTGGYNTAVGTWALRSNDLGTFNTAVGYYALQGSTGNSDNNTAVGYMALSGSSATNVDNNTAVGYRTLASCTGVCINNTAIGVDALYANTTGDSNVAIGNNALDASTNGTGNVGIGLNALTGVTTGTNSNTAIGRDAFRDINGNSDENTAIGYQAGYRDADGFRISTTTNYQRMTAIGTNAVAQASSSLILGGAGADAVNVGIGTTIPINTLSVSPVRYSTGTASQSGTTVTGVGTTFTADMVGSKIIFRDGASAMITAFVSTTSLTVDTSQTVSSSVYRIHYGGLQVTNAGKIGIQTLAPTADLTFGQINGATTARTINVEAQTKAATGGNGLTVTSGAGNTSGAGGLLTLQGGTGGTTGVGGAVVIQGGNGGATSGNGGAVSIVGGTVTSGTVGDINIGSVGSSTAASTIHIADTSDATGTQAITIGSNAKAANTLTLLAGSTNGISLGASTTITGNLLPEAAGTRDLGSTTYEFDELYVADDSGIVLGLDQDATLAYDEAGDDRTELTGTGASLFIEDRLLLGALTGTLTDDGVANDVLTPASSYYRIAIDEAADAGIPDMTISETGAQDGQMLTIINYETDGTHDTFTITDSAGVVHLPGAATLTLGPYDSVTLMYVNDRWITLSNSNN